VFSNDVRLCLWLFLPAKNNVYDTFAAHSFFLFYWYICTGSAN
jgi:hypothetical protein